MLNGLASGTFIAIALAMVSFAIWYWTQKKNPTLRQKWNKEHGLDKDFVPPKYLGDVRTYPIMKTPGGIKVKTFGFHKEDIPLEREGVKARVILADIDEIWLNVIEKIRNKINNFLYSI